MLWVVRIAQIRARPHRSSVELDKYCRVVAGATVKTDCFARNVVIHLLSGQSDPNKEKIEAFDNNDISICGNEIAIGATYHDAVMNALLK